MKIKVIKADALTDEHVATWSRLQRANPALESPYFRPEFTRAVAEVCDNVEVAVLEQDGKPVGFFPFQRTRLNTARPVGGPLSDFHGLIARPELQVDAKRLIRVCGVRSWHFDHLIAEQESFQGFHYYRSGSPYMDLSRGYEAYRAERKTAHSNVIKQVTRKGRQLERECGPLRCELHAADSFQVFQTLLRWKSDQYRRTRVPNIFGYDWTVNLLHRVLDERGDAFYGMLSVLYAGDRLAAVDLGICSYGVLHSWFPTYDPELKKYSPGHVLLLKVAEAAPSAGISRIHLGKGAESYKCRYMSGEVMLAEGCVGTSVLGRAVRRSLCRMREWARGSRWRSPMQVPVRMLRPLREWIALGL
jgi:CelD/BcsL family acetyltransferase involved in cellulose biosynthesis